MDDGLDLGAVSPTEVGIEIILEPTTIAHLQQVAERTFGDLGLVKAVVDIERQYGSSDWLEFDSIVNLRPPTNRSRSVQNPATQALVIDVVRSLVQG